jgi:hypothetical protein
MHCPNCSSEVPSMPTCPRCGWSLTTTPNASLLSGNPDLGGSSLAAVGTQDASHIPLTLTQKARLIFDCVPLLVVLLGFVFAVTILDDIVGAPPPTALLLFLGFVMLVLGWAAVQRMRDLASGVALVQEDVLQRSWRSRGQGPGHFYGRFARLGRLRMIPKCHFQSQNGRRYRVVYSPASKIVWALEPTEQRAVY